MKAQESYINGYNRPPQGFIYDVALKGYDQSFWSTLAGDPAVDTGALVLSAAGIASFIETTFGILDADITLPAVPTAGDLRTFGFALPSSDTGIYFDFDGETVKAVVNIPDYEPWEAEIDTALFTAAAHSLKIKWTPDAIAFFVDDECVALWERARGIKEMTITLPMFVNNEVADDLSFTSIKLTECGRIN